MSKRAVALAAALFPSHRGNFYQSRKCFTWNICFGKYTANVGQWQWNGGQGKREILEENERLLI